MDTILREARADAHGVALAVAADMYQHGRHCPNPACDAGELERRARKLARDMGVAWYQVVSAPLNPDMMEPCAVAQ